MSRFADDSVKDLAPYVPGEQPQDMQYVKLNTNESPFAPSPKVIAALNKEERRKLRLYSDPETKELDCAIAEYLGVDRNMVLSGNGSDEILAFIFRTFCGKKGMACPDVSYGFYPVFCQMFGIKYVPVPLDENFEINVDLYENVSDNVIIANPNAQTGVFLPLDKVEKLVCQNKDRLVAVDEAYVDFGGESAVPLVKKHDNLIVVQTFSKSRQLAGARIGFAVADSKLIADLKTVKFSFNPYNVNRLSMIAGREAMKDAAYFNACRKKIMSARAYLVKGLKARGFEVLPSLANFVLAKSDRIGGEELYKRLKARGVLVRHLSDRRITNFVRITVGTRQNVNALFAALDGVLGEL